MSFVLPPRKKKDNQAGSATILIAVESLEFADALSRALGERDFSCIVADSGKKAFSLFLERRPDVVLLSFNIRGKEDGIEAAREILGASSRTKVVILTDSNSKVTDTAEHIGIELFMSKDTSLPRMLNSICAVSNLKKLTCSLIAR
jgi:DNA-binding response OmpR family regulator